jgi:prepilin-type N-terminal cleavage/methylation domain-containing protein
MFKFGFTLIETLVSLAVIVIVSIATIPIFAGLSGTQNLDKNVQNVLTGIKLAQAKAFSGSVYNSQKVYWGVQICQGTDLNNYNLGYSLDSDEDNVPDGFTSIRSKTLSTGYQFDNCATSNIPFYFERLSSNIVDLDGNYLNQTEVTIVETDDTSNKKTIKVGKGGKIEVYTP